MGVIDRTNKVVYAKVATPNAEGKQLTAKQLLNILNKVSEPNNGNTIMTDEFRGYSPLTANEYVHLKVDHRNLFADGDIHTNNIESFWATLKRGIYGI